MNIVRWLTNHPILSVWALTIVALLLSLGGTGGKKHGEEVNIASNEHVEVNSSAGGQGSDHHVAENTAANAGQQSTVVATATSVSANTMNTVANHQQVQVAVPAVSAPVNNATVNTGDTNDTKAAASEAVTTPAEDVASTEVSSTGQALSASDLGNKSVDDLLLMAREAYWNNGLDEAASIYQQLIEREPNVVEHKGELGNVYWRQGFPEKSASLYADIAIPMIKKGNAERVSNMIGFIGLFYPDKAAEINKYMQSVVK